jgi:hypothetical protein
VLAGGPLDFGPEAAGEGAGVGRHGVVQDAVAGFEAEVVLVVPGGRADRGRPIALSTAGSPSSMPQYAPVCLVGAVGVEGPGGGCLASAAAEFGGPGGERAFRHAWQAWKAHRDGRDDGQRVEEPDGPQILQVAAVTFANGSDNLGVYLPVFARSGPRGSLHTSS